ncbi:head maturation protease [Gordonia phage GAL1]|nr:head maturation protease [Gordonia phage GAL1]AKJ72021.1 hypothetical protein GAL1_6 [Gordonia phage GAL1]
MAEGAVGHRERVGQWAVQQIEKLWAAVNPYDEAQVRSFAQAASRVMQAAQTSVARATAAAQTRQLTALGVDVPTAVPSAPVDVRAAGVEVDDGVADLDRSPTTVEYQPDATPEGVDEATPSRVRVTVRNTTTEEVLTRPARVYRYERSQGQDDAAANEAAKSRVRVIVDDNLMLSQRIAESESLAQAADLDDRVLGYRRVIHPELSRGGVCGMCIVAADRLYRISELKPIHHRCKCTVAAVTKDFDPKSINDDDLSRFYKDAQGNTLRDLKRTRYDVDEHGELGAVLVPKAKYRSRAQRAKDRAKKTRQTARA